MFAVQDHSYLIGKIAKTSPLAVELEVEYERLFEVGNVNQIQMIDYYCHCGGRYELSLIFLDEPVYKKKGMTWYCLKDIGTGASGDWYWLTLDQLIICE